MYLPSEWKLVTHKSTSKRIEGVCSTGDDWKKLGQSFQMWITFITRTHMAGHNNHVSAFTLWKRVFLLAESGAAINRGHLLIDRTRSIHAYRPAGFLSLMETKTIFFCNAPSPFNWCSATLQVQKPLGVLLYLKDKAHKKTTLVQLSIQSLGLSKPICSSWHESVKMGHKSMVSFFKQPCNLILRGKITVFVKGV